MTLAFKAEDEVVLLVGETIGWLGQSLYLRDVCGREEGAPPPVDLVEEKENGDFVRGVIRDGLASAVHDVADGGLAVALAEMAMAGNIGVTLEEGPSDTPGHGFWFGEDQARYVVTASRENAEKIVARAQDASVMVQRLGVTGGDAVKIAGERPLAVATLRDRHESWFPNYMSIAAA
jgi:phosphoribosylformylglycinamidine synthase